MKLGQSSESNTKKINCKGRIKMNFDRLTNISKELTVGEINNPYEFTIEIAINTCTAGLRRQFPQD